MDETGTLLGRAQTVFALAAAVLFIVLWLGAGLTWWLSLLVVILSFDIGARAYGWAWRRRRVVTRPTDHPRS